MTDTAPWRTDARAELPILPLKAVADYFVSSVDKLVSDSEQPVRLCNYTDVYKNDYIRPDMDLMSATASEAEIERFRLLVNDVVITKDSETWDDIGVPALVVETADDLVCGYHLAVIRPFADALSGRFLFRCLQARCIRLHLELSSTGVTRFGLPKEEIGHVLLPLPPLAEQERIADYLDAETARMDALMAEKERMLALLEEKRAALVSHAVTRGLNTDAPTKPSGLDWLGDIPAHWEVKRLKHLARIGNGSTPSRDKVDYWDEFGCPWLTSTVVNARCAAAATEFVSALALTECHLPKILPPAILMGITGQGKTRGKTSVLEFEATINQHMAYLQPFEKSFDCLYMSHLLDSAYTYLRSISDGAGSTKGALTCEQISNLAVPIPPHDEQTAILAHLAKERARTAELEEALRGSIALLKERRAALIAAAVTGHLAIGEA